MQSPRARALLDAKADASVHMSGGWTALMLACQAGSAPIVSALVHVHSSVDARLDNGWTGLMLASAHGHLEIANVLLGVHVDVNAKANNGCGMRMCPVAHWCEGVAGAKGGRMPYNNQADAEPRPKLGFDFTSWRSILSNLLVIKQRRLLGRSERTRVRIVHVIDWVFDHDADERLSWQPRPRCMRAWWRR